MPDHLEASGRDRLQAAVSAALEAVTRLELVIAPGGERPKSQMGSAPPPESKPPWQSGPANLVFSLRSHARETEVAWRRVIGMPVRPRGGSDANTSLALRALVNLAEAAGQDRALDEAKWLERWDGAAARVLGDASAVVRLPRQPGEPERPCPFCACFTLRYWPLHGLVKCINPGCRDGEGRKPSARIEWSGFTHQLELVWCDGVSGLPPLPGEAA